MIRQVLIVLEAGDAYPSGYVRGLIYRDSFKKAGIPVRYVSRQCVTLVRFLFAPPRWLAPFLSRAMTAFFYRVGDGIACIKEFFIVLCAKKADVIYTSKVSSYSFIQKLRNKTKARLVMDFGDALWLPSARTSRFEEVLKSVDAVTTDNSATAQYVKAFNSHCTVIPDCPQVEDFDRLRSTRSARTDRITLGWIGTPSTLYNLFVIWEVLEKLFAKNDRLHLRLVGTGWEPRFLPPFEKVRYSCLQQYNRQEMMQEVLNMDIGLFPLQLIQASDVRGILKATVYMAGEVPVVASAVGQSVELIQDGSNGYLATSAEDWENKLNLLIQDPAQRKRIAQAGLETVRKDYTVDKTFGKLLQVLNG